MVTSIDEAAVWQQYKSEGSPLKEKAERILTELYLDTIVKPLARRVMRGKRFIGGVADMEDLIQEGSIVLVKRIKSYDLARGVNFQMYAMPRIYGAMYDFLRKISILSGNDNRRLKKYETAADAMRSDGNGTISIDDLRRRTGLTIEQLLQAQYHSSFPIMVNMGRLCVLAKSHNELPVDFESRTSGPDARLLYDDLKEVLTKGLNRDERLIAILYYLEDLTMREIGETLGLSESRVSQMHSGILKRLKERSEQILKEVA